MKVGGGEAEVSAGSGVSGVRGVRGELTCCCVGVLVGAALLAALVAVILTKDSTVESTALRQVHVLMSHGERTPSGRELAALGAATGSAAAGPRHPFWPHGAGALTNEGKMVTFEMGALLRKRYEQFMGPLYDSESSAVIASDSELSKTTALLLSAGLWPPRDHQLWNESLLWQPVPYVYPPRAQDVLLYEENCPRYKQEKDRILQAFIEEGLLTPYKEFFQKVAHLTNTSFSTPQDAFHLNNLFLIQDDIKVANPKWAKHVRRKLAEVAKLEYSIMFHNNLLKKLSGGAVLHHILQSALSASVSARSERVRLVVRAGSAQSVAALLAASVAPPPRLPDPAVALLFELHERLSPASPDDTHAQQRYGFKIYYWDDDSAEPRLMQVPGCGALCPLGTFRQLAARTVTIDYEADCRLATID